MKVKINRAEGLNIGNLLNADESASFVTVDATSVTVDGNGKPESFSQVLEVNSDTDVIVTTEVIETPVEEVAPAEEPEPVEEAPVAPVAPAEAPATDTSEPAPEEVAPETTA